MGVAALIAEHNKAAGFTSNDLVILGVTERATEILFPDRHRFLLLDRENVPVSTRYAWGSNQMLAYEFDGEVSQGETLDEFEVNHTPTCIAYSYAIHF